MKNANGVTLLKPAVFMFLYNKFTLLLINGHQMTKNSKEIISDSISCN